MYMKQFELWPTCYNNCTFCFNKETSHLYDPEKQKKTLLRVLEEVDTVWVDKTDKVSVELIGGDFFQGQLKDKEVYELFFNLLKKLYKLGEEGKIHQVTLFVTLTLGGNEDLYKSIDILKPTKDSKLDLWISTSYDTRGRFITQDRLDNWDKHMKLLSKIDKIHLNTTIILTQDFVDKVNSGEFDFIEFQKLYNTTLFFKQPFVPASYEHSLLHKDFPSEENHDLKQAYMKEYPWFLPKRADTLKVLKKLRDLGILDRLMGLEYRADELLTNFGKTENEWVKSIRNKKENTEGCGESVGDCGHFIIYQCYSDSDKCLLCDRDSLLDTI